MLFQGGVLEQQRVTSLCLSLVVVVAVVVVVVVFFFVFVVVHCCCCCCCFFLKLIYLNNFDLSGVDAQITSLQMESEWESSFKERPQTDHVISCNTWY